MGGTHPILNSRRFHLSPCSEETSGHLCYHKGGQDLYRHLIDLGRILYPVCLPYQTFQMSSTFELPPLPLVKYFGSRAKIILEKALKSQQDEHKRKSGYTLILSTLWPA